MLNVVIIGLGGFVGAVARYLITALVHRWLVTDFPAGTFVVNVFGSFIIGAIMYLTQNDDSLSPQMKLFLTIGIVGAFTTFSTFSFETLALFHSKAAGLAVLNILGNVMLGLLAVWGGYTLIKVVR